MLLALGACLLLQNLTMLLPEPIVLHGTTELGGRRCSYECKPEEEKARLCIAPCQIME